MPILLVCGFSTLFLVAVSLRGAEWRFPDRSPSLLALVASIGVGDRAAYALFNVGVRHADTSVVATATAPYAVVPVVAGVALAASARGRLSGRGSPSSSRASSSSG